ncbi:MAG: SRPBCC domain-containing protein [Nitrospinae bacterium]|nr:SRPBCC domain-containing protein [Nitrospinota bacterium]
MNESNFGVNSAGQRELVITRVFDAPRALVWQVWTDPKHIMRWWGPNGFSNSSCESDLRVGGRFHLNMSAPDGATYPCKGIYREIAEPERIVYESEADESHPCGAGLPPRSLVTLTFAESDGKTTLTLHTSFESEARRDAANKAGFSGSWTECLERLGEYLNS